MQVSYYKSCICTYPIIVPILGNKQANIRHTPITTTLQQITCNNLKCYLNIKYMTKQWFNVFQDSNTLCSYIVESTMTTFFYILNKYNKLISFEKNIYSYWELNENTTIRVGIIPHYHYHYTNNIMIEIVKIMINLPRIDWSEQMIKQLYSKDVRQ